MVTMFASVNYTGNSSMFIGIRVIAENFYTGTVKHTNTSYFTMVAKGEDGKPRKVPALILETRDEIRRFLEAIKRKDLRKIYKIELDNAKTHLEVDTEMNKLVNERCKVELK
jgi:acyl-CoA hydrolase